MCRLTNILYILKTFSFQYGCLRCFPNLYRLMLKVCLREDVTVYAHIQKVIYTYLSRKDSKKLCVGSYAEHENYPYEDHLTHHFTGEKGLALDFGCGPGRMIKRMARLFGRVDGVDISKTNLDLAREYSGQLAQEPKLYESDGLVFNGVSSNNYDFVYSTIAMQHIALHDTRMIILKEMHRILKPNGCLAIQMTFTDDITKHYKYDKMAYEAKSPTGIACWRDNPYWATTTNSGYDVLIDSRSLLHVSDDLQSIGFINIDHFVKPPPHAGSPDFIFLFAQKIDQ